MLSTVAIQPALALLPSPTRISLSAPGVGATRPSAPPTRWKPSLANCMPSAVTAPPVLSTVTMPASPPKMANASAGWRVDVIEPVAFAQFACGTDHTPLPPPIRVLLASPFAFQKFSVKPFVLIRLTCLLAVRFWMVKPEGGMMPPLVSVSVPP